jgi:hypothetical protein
MRQRKTPTSSSRDADVKLANVKTCKKRIPSKGRASRNDRAFVDLMSTLSIKDIPTKAEE